MDQYKCGDVLYNRLQRVTIYICPLLLLELNQGKCCNANAVDGAVTAVTLSALPESLSDVACGQPITYSLIDHYLLRFEPASVA